MKKGISIFVMLSLMIALVFASIGSMNSYEVAGEQDFPPYTGDSIEL